MPDFVHLHCHTQFSLLDGASEIGRMMDKAVSDGQKGVALTDHGNMFGAFKFVAEAKKRDLKAIVGCEFYLVEDRFRKSFSRAAGERDVRYHQLLLAKNQAGYRNLSKLCSLGFIDGRYNKFPRIDKELLLRHHEGLIATSCCIGAEVPQAILKGDVEKAEELLKWWLDLFGEDYYIELQRHRGLEDIDGLGVSQEDVNQTLLGFAKKYNIKVIATNDSHYVEETDWKAHDILLCVNTGSKIEADNRFKFPSTDFFFKTKDQMSKIFHDVPFAIDNTMEIYDKIETPQLERDILLPNFPIPQGFQGEPDFLRHLVYEGAKVRYGEITEVVRERIDLELGIIKDMGFNGYFLIVQDFIEAARNMNVVVGPGRGSAAGSAVAYCLKITNIDPIKYNLLFERFLNPERISMPDIDIDFDDDGRQRVIDWVVDKYGENQVAQIVTFGTMAAKSSIRDVGRVLDLPLSDVDQVAKLVPTKPGTKLAKILGRPLKEVSKDWQSEEMANIKLLHDFRDGKDLRGETITLAQQLEGSVRNTGIHAAGVIIAPDDLLNHIPVCTSKDSDLLITQFDGSIVEDAGMLKMDFLGLKTLSIIKDAIQNVVDRHGEESSIDPDEIPLDDPKTYEMIQRGEMIGIFQFESDGMQKHLKDLKPTNIEDLIAMNALYRPGPMDYIPSFIARKHGKEVTEYPHEWLEEMLKPTYGIMVYQEQIMQCAQIMADYSLGSADMLRRAMGKKKQKEMDKHNKIFVEGATKKGVAKEKAEEIFEVMAKFASYGFNRSHAAAYSVLAFQTAYLKAHYPAEFIASVLTHNKSDITKLNFFLREAKRMDIDVLGPDVNESKKNFTVNAKGQIRFGMSALKGVGEGPVEAIIEERTANGPFTNIFDMTKRLNLRSVNKKCLESLAVGGGFDSLGEQHRAQYFAPSGKYDSFIEHALKYGGGYQAQKASNTNSLFGNIEDIMIDEPDFPNAVPWPLIKKLTKEKEVTGIYISGHPLDDYRLELKHFTTCTLDKIDHFKEHKIKVAGIVSMAQHKVNQKGSGFGIFAVQDFVGTLELRLFQEHYIKYKDFFIPGEAIFIEGVYRQSRHNDNFYFNVSNVRLLETVGQEMTKSLTIKVPLGMVNNEFINFIDDICARRPGKHNLKLLLLDKENEISLNVVSKTKRINADSHMIDELEAMGILYKLN